MKLNKPKESNQPNRLVLGTAQLGMDYGIANTTGQPVYNTARSIIQEAWESGINEFDTAQAYGQSEQILGQVFKNLDIADKVRVITKLAPDVDHSDRPALNNALEISLNNLGVEFLYCLMLHREEMLDLWEKGLRDNLMDFVDSGRVEYIGISVYSPKRAVLALNTDGISMIQLPTNVMDRRFEQAGVFQFAYGTEKIIYIRSIFLQGLLLMSTDHMPERMRFAAPVLNRLTLLSQDAGLTINELCIGYIKNAFPHARLIFGAETPVQVKENLKCWNVPWPNEMSRRIQTEFKEVDQMILNPSLWPKRKQ
jgi:aryl-alcohol dehydrogenase-like predicted oxidoreductase